MSTVAYDGLHRLIDDGVKVLLDSGVFWLATRHRKKMDISMEESIGLPPDQLDGYDWLWDRYVALVKEFGDKVWGYVEVDQGGTAQKRETRKRLADLGISPIPVYHPLGDGWDYFDELAESYDRICFSNLSSAAIPVRQRLVATAYDRHLKYPDLWIHLLGFTPCDWNIGMPMDSSDSSSWMRGVRWDGHSEESMMRRFSTMPRNFQYRLGSDRADDDGWVAQQRMGVLAQHIQQQGSLDYLKRLAAIGGESLDKSNASRAISLATWK